MTEPGSEETVEYLYCLPGSDDMFTDPSDVIEEFDYTGDPEQDADLPENIEVWSRLPAHYFLPTTDFIISKIEEWMEYGSEDDDFSPFRDLEEVKTAADNFLAVLASNIALLATNDWVGLLPVTWGEQVLINGEPAWVDAADE